MTGPAVTSAATRSIPAPAPVDGPLARPMPSARPDPAPAPRRYGRWIALVALSLLLHAIVFDLLPHWSLDSTDDINDAPLQVTLMPPIRPVDVPKVEPVAPAVPVPPKRPPSSRPRPRPPKTAPPVFVPESVDEVPQVQLTPPAGPPASIAPSSTASGASTSSSDALPAVAPASPPVQPAPVASAAPTVTATTPQSARLFYDVVSLDGRNAAPTHYYGVGTIDWSIADGRYRSDLQASYKALFIKIGILALHSEGGIGPAGLVPDRYTETPWRRAAVSTNFNRDERQSITFSASQASVPLVAGAQDRLSILFQIGGLLLANPGQGAAGGSIEVPVAGVRGDVERWIFQGLGIESLDTGIGSLSATHLRRTPRPGSNDRTIDVWIAQDAGGYPAKVLYTEPNGTTIEMLLDRIGRPVADAAAANAAP